ncbi:hypothetical protein FHG87_019928 [Trinorchestia longiramus]|nr:hypothetical protein FHG87_019928 [Trinorchestia longiramus]
MENASFIKNEPNTEAGLNPCFNVDVTLSREEKSDNVKVTPTDLAPEEKDNILHNLRNNEPQFSCNYDENESDTSAGSRDVGLSAQDTGKKRSIGLSFYLELIIPFYTFEGCELALLRLGYVDLNFFKVKTLKLFPDVEIKERSSFYQRTPSEFNADEEANAFEVTPHHPLLEVQHGYAEKRHGGALVSFGKDVIWEMPGLISYRQIHGGRGRNMDVTVRVTEQAIANNREARRMELEDTPSVQSCVTEENYEEMETEYSIELETNSEQANPNQSLNLELTIPFYSFEGPQSGHIKLGYFDLNYNGKLSSARSFQMNITNLSPVYIRVQSLFSACDRLDALAEPPANISSEDNWEGIEPSLSNPRRRSCRDLEEFLDHCANSETSMITDHNDDYNNNENVDNDDYVDNEDGGGDNEDGGGDSEDGGDDSEDGGDDSEDGGDDSEDGGDDSEDGGDDSEDGGDDSEDGGDDSEDGGDDNEDGGDDNEDGGDDNEDGGDNGFDDNNNNNDDCDNDDRDNHDGDRDDDHDVDGNDDRDGDDVHNGNEIDSDVDCDNDCENDHDTVSHESSDDFYIDENEKNLTSGGAIVSGRRHPSRRKSRQAASDEGSIVPGWGEGPSRRGTIRGEGRKSLVPRLSLDLRSEGSSVTCPGTAALTLCHRYRSYCLALGLLMINRCSRNRHSCNISRCSSRRSSSRRSSSRRSSSRCSSRRSSSSSSSRRSSRRSRRSSSRRSSSSSRRSSSSSRRSSSRRRSSSSSSSSSSSRRSRSSSSSSSRRSSSSSSSSGTMSVCSQGSVRGLQEL